MMLNMMLVMTRSVWHATYISVAGLKEQKMLTKLYYSMVGAVLSDKSVAQPDTITGRLSVYISLLHLAPAGQGALKKA